VRKIREALRLRHGCGLGIRQTSQSLGAAHSTVGEILSRAEAAGLSWPLPDDLDDSQLEARLFPSNRPKKRQEPDWGEVHIELRRKGVTLQLLWLEYKQACPDGYEYSRFCELYRIWRQKVEVVMRQEYRAGEKALVDFAGPTVRVVDPKTGAASEAHGREQLRVRGGLLVRRPPFVDHRPYPRPRVLRRRAGDRRSRPNPDCGEGPLPLRARLEPNIPGLGSALRHRRHPGTPRKGA